LSKAQRPVARTSDKTPDTLLISKPREDISISPQAFARKRDNLSHIEKRRCYGEKTKEGGGEKTSGPKRVKAQNFYSWEKLQKERQQPLRGR